MDPDFRSSIERGRPPAEDSSRTSSSKKADTSSNGGASNIIDLLSGGRSVPELAESLGLNQDLSEKVLVPLANMVQKYNVGQSVAQSKSGQAAGDLLTVLGDIAPVIQGLTEYLAGQRKKLEDDDLAYLEAIKQAQSQGDFSDLFNIGEEVEEPASVAAPVDARSEQRRQVEKTLGASLPDDWDPTKGINWEQVLGAQPETMKNPNSTLGFSSLEEIEAEADRLSGKSKVKTDNYDLSNGLSLDESLVPATGAFMSMEDLIAEAGLKASDAAEVRSAGVGGFGTEAAPPTVQPKTTEVKSTPQPVQTLSEVSLDMDDFMSVAQEASDEEVLYLSDEEVEELRESGFIFEEIDEDTEWA